MKVSTVFQILLVAGVANAQFGGGRPGQGQGGQGQNNGQNGQNQGQNNGQNGQNNNNGGNNGGNNNGGGGNLALNPANVQKNSASTGQEQGAEKGQAASATDNANFINFCTGKTLTNGLQTRSGSCNGIRKLHCPTKQMRILTLSSYGRNPCFKPHGLCCHHFTQEQRCCSP
jgi:transcription initiation factor TFIID subunit 15